MIITAICILLALSIAFNFRLYYLLKRYKTAYRKALNSRNHINDLLVIGLLAAGITTVYKTLKFKDL